MLAVMRGHLPATLALALALPVLVSAHHTISALYDITTLVTLNGIVVEVDWEFPHVLLHLAVRGGDGARVDWTIEMRAPNIMRREGVPADSIKVGDAIAMDVFAAKDGSRKAAAETITLATGTRRVTMLPNGTLPPER